MRIIFNTCQRPLSSGGGQVDTENNRAHNYKYKLDVQMTWYLIIRYPFSF